MGGGLQEGSRFRVFVEAAGSTQSRQCRCSKAVALFRVCSCLCLWLLFSLVAGPLLSSTGPSNFLLFLLWCLVVSLLRDGRDALGRKSRLKSQFAEFRLPSVLGPYCMMQQTDGNAAHLCVPLLSCHRVPAGPSAMC
ncbi:hypothetical protein LZ30DRAFT_733654 [Colletotrichum cereale]|nr:hypothetical protein LZ30DRAFT_733654 [Colletotrichum cereale]